MSPIALLILYCVLILLVSLIGGWVPLWIHLTHRRMQLAISLVAGFMLGVGLLHLLPHALEYASAQDVVLWMVIGIMVMFFLERFFCFHHHDAPYEGGHGHEHSDQARDHALTWSGAAVGLTLHSILAGAALAASVEAEQASTWAGLAVFLVIFLHKPFDSMSLLTLMSVGGWTKGARHLVNALFALAIPTGVLLFHMGVAVAGHDQSGAGVGAALAFASGLFVCIALSDLLPELQFHQHDRIKLSFALLLGLALAFAINQIESHAHEHDDVVEPQVEHRHNDGARSG